MAVGSGGEGIGSGVAEDHGSANGGGGHTIGCGADGH